MTPRIAWTLLFVVAAAWSGPAAAQVGGQAAFAQAEAAFARGERLFAQNSFAAAEAEFRSAYDLMRGHPNQSLILVNVARSIEQQGGRAGEALALYERMLAVSGSNAGAADARRIAGERSAALRAQGVRSGESINPVGPIVLGGGAVVAIAGGIIGGVALAQREAVLSRCIDSRCPPDTASSAAEIDTLAIVADVLLFGGLAIAAVGVILTLVLPGESAVRAAASCGPTGCYALLSGRFR